MNAYFLVGQTDEATDAVLKKLTRFNVRTAGCFAAYGAVDVKSMRELREASERIAAVAPSDVRVLISIEPEAEPTMRIDTSGAGIPDDCYDPYTGQINFDCLGSAEPSVAPKADYFAVAELRVTNGEREAVFAQLTVSGGVVGLARLTDPNRVLVEFGARDPELLLKALDGVGSIRGVARMRAGIAVSPLRAESAKSV